MKVFITGGTGFIGSHLVENLLERKNVEIFVLIRNLHQLRWLEGLQITPLQGDLFSIPELPRDLDYVFHLAGITKTLRLADYYTVNQKGTASLLDALRSQRILPKKFIYLSSFAAGRPSFNGIPVREDQAPGPVSCYGHSKLLGEYEVQKNKDIFSVVNLRVGPVYGPRDKDFVAYFKSIRLGILPSPGGHQGRMNFCYVKDLVQAFILSAEKEIKSGETFNIAHPETSSWDAIGEMAAEILRKKILKIKVPFPMLLLTAWLSEMISRISRTPNILNREKLKETKAMIQWGWAGDTHKAQEFLRFAPNYPLKKGLEETLSWYISHGWL
jgi:nucleoside-diphosphate-sugar epimerase